MTTTSTTMTGPYITPPPVNDYERYYEPLRMSIPMLLTTLEPAYGWLCREMASECNRYYRLEAEGKADEQTECGKRLDRLQQRIAVLDSFRRAALDI